MELNTPVLIIFFNRPETLQLVFDRVREAKPKMLFLSQDGPRVGSEDLKKIQQCREIVSRVDWDCEVKINYSSVNVGCGLGPSNAISWAFSIVDKLIVLEDDCIPETTFFEYCQIMLNKYEKDLRISYISGLNHFEDWNSTQDDYFFSKTGAIWGWALWKRSWQNFSYYVEGINDKYLVKQIERVISNKKVCMIKMTEWKTANASKDNSVKLNHWDIQWGFVKYSQNQLVIVPKFNQIKNVGVGISSTHAKGLKNIIYKKGKYFVFIPTKKLGFPLKHPTYVVCDYDYDDLVYKAQIIPPIIKLKRKIKNILSIFRGVKHYE